MEPKNTIILLLVLDLGGTLVVLFDGTHNNIRWNSGGITGWNTQ